MPFISTIPGHNTYKSECEKMQINPKAPPMAISNKQIKGNNYEINM